MNLKEKLRKINLNDYKEKEIILHGILKDICHAVPPKRYLEIGSWVGDSLKKVLQNSNPHPELITCIDDWSDSYGDLYIEDSIHLETIIVQENYKGKFEIAEESSHNILIPFIQEGRLYDLILVDGDHTYEGAWMDLRQAWELLEDEGILIFDDIYHKDMPWLIYCFMRFIEVIKNESILLYMPPYAQQGAGVLMKIGKK